MPFPTRRDLITGAGTCAAHLALAATLLPRPARAAWTRPTAGRIVAREPFGRLEEIGPGVWALVSTPLGGDYTTLANGGLVAGRNAVLAIEGFATPQGARWLAGRAREITGRPPTHVLVTHYHGDHVNGLAGFAADGAAPAVHVTRATAGLVADRNRPEDPARARLLGGAVPVDPAREQVLDLGGRTVRIRPEAGHTPSDLVVELDDPAITFGGDLLWNGMFPNYMDATPPLLAATVAGLRRGNEALYVPGHGPVARTADFDRYAALLAEIERAAREAHRRGTPAAEAAAAYRLPETVGSWHLFGPRFLPNAFAAWYRALGS
jgi:glyoxylase-like metal-dependent hydrolase (beta-lactamase superfamily II)